MKVHTHQRAWLCKWLLSIKDKSIISHYINNFMAYYREWCNTWIFVSLSTLASEQRWAYVFLLYVCVCGCVCACLREYVFDITRCCLRVGFLETACSNYHLGFLSSAWMNHQIINYIISHGHPCIYLRTVCWHTHLPYLACFISFQST